MREPKLAHILVKNVSQNRTKLQQSCNKQNKTNKQTKKRPFFLPKTNKVFLRPIFQNLKGRSVLDKNAKWGSKSNLPLSHSPDRKIFPLKRVLEKYVPWQI